MNTASDALKKEPWPEVTGTSTGTLNTGPANVGLESVYLREGKYGPYQVIVRAASSSVIVDEPFGAGGLGSGPTPFDLLSGALGACAFMTMRCYATCREWPVDQMVVRVGHDRATLAARDRFLLEVQVTGRLTHAQVDTLLEVATRCPVHTTIARGSDIEMRLIPPGESIEMAVGRATHMRLMQEACDD